MDIKKILLGGVALLLFASQVYANDAKFQDISL